MDTLRNQIVVVCILTARVPVLIVSVREGEQGESEGRRVVRYPDAQQLFVGNVPHDVDKTELKEFFERKSAQQRKKYHVFKNHIYIP